MLSKEYDEYLREHVDAVKKAVEWMGNNLTIELSTYEKWVLYASVMRHDRSKYGMAEYAPYDEYFYGMPDDDMFNHAWLHHIHVNPHHWQYWLLVTGDGVGTEKMVPLEMPSVFVYEMIADWWSFSWRSGNLYEVFDWYEKNRGCIILHPRTRELVERILGEIKTRLEEGDV